MLNPETEFSRVKHRAFELFSRAAAPIKHFTPEDSSDGILRDRFGNRLISSPTIAYLDKEEDPVKAAVLISREGEALIRKAKGLLKPIEQALVESDIPNPSRVLQGETLVFEFGERARLERMYELDGGQSNISILELEGEKLVIKKIQIMPTLTDFFTNQPYINEMLQVQSIAYDLREELAEAGFVMPTFLFATGQVCGVRFEQGPRPDSQKIQEKLPGVIAFVEPYIEEQLSGGNMLWKDTLLDERIRIRQDYSSYVDRPDGKIAWVDPLVNVPIEKLIMESKGQIDFSVFL